MERNTQGWIALAAAAAMLATSLGQTLSGMAGWSTALEPSFFGQVLTQIGAAVAAYVSGQIMPTSRRLVAKPDVVATKGDEQ